MTPIKVLVVDDHPVVRFGLRSLLSLYSDICLVGEADSGSAALAAAQRYQPDVVLLDIRLGGLDGIEVAERLSQYDPSPRVIILTSYDEDTYVVRALQADVHAYLLKHASDETLVNAIRSVYKGERLLSPTLLDRVIREFAELRRAQTGLTGEDRQILAMLTEGASNAKIAAARNWSTTSVKRRVQEIFAKLQVSTRAQAAAEAVHRGLV